MNTLPFTIPDVLHSFARQPETGVLHVKEKQNGAAVIMVMLIVALATTLAVAISKQQNLWQRQVETQFDHSQARRLSIAGIDWARAILADDAHSNNTDHETEMWTLRLPAMPVENGEVIGTIEDRQGLFNLNSLVHEGAASPPEIAKFQRLLSILGLPVALALNLADWIDVDSAVQSSGGAEDAYYLGLSRPYRTANRALVEVGELARIKGFDTQNIARLKPFVAALPTNGAINVNFAPAEVLAAVAQNLSVSDARLLIQQRRGNPFKDLADFKQRLPNSNIKIEDSDIAVNSSFFLITGRAFVNDAQVVTQALVQRSQAWPSVVWQSVQ